MVPSLVAPALLQGLVSCAIMNVEADRIHVIATHSITAGDQALMGTIYVIRHAERPNSKACLSIRGWHRAVNLINLFNGTTRQPKKLFAYNYGWFRRVERFSSFAHFPCER